MMSNNTNFLSDALAISGRKSFGRPKILVSNLSLSRSEWDPVSYSRAASVLVKLIMTIPDTSVFSFRPSIAVIKGWDESVIDMSIGEIAKIHCSPDYAYGAGGFPAWGIEANSELVFEIEVLSYA